MKLKIPQAAERRTLSGLLASALAATVSAAMVFLTPTAASAIALPVPLGTTATYSVLAGQGVTNTGNSVLAHDLGTHPNPAITGFPPGQVGGAIHPADAAALQAKADLLVAYNNAAGQAVDFALPAGIGGGPALLPGVYKATAGVGITGDLVLDGQGSSDAVWVFQIPESLTTATSSRILLTNGASACNVFWQIGEDASLGVTTAFVGTLMAENSITVNQGTNVEGRLLAEVGSVTLNNNRIFLGGCAASTAGGATSGTPGAPGTTTSGGLLGGGLVSGGLVTGGVLGGPIVGSGGTSGNTAGNSSGNTAGNTAGNNAGNTAGNTTGGETAGNSAGNTTGGNGPGGNGHAPGGPGGPGGPGHGGNGGNGGNGKHDHGGKLDLGQYINPGKPDHGKYDHGREDHGKYDHGREDHGKYDHGQEDHGKYDQGQDDHGKQSGENFGYDDVPKSHGGDDHSQGDEG
ncbi:ice-binding family protein [Streptomyces sp. NPDC048252]|uniref:ice-binding family protein n=1 Tax=Streptomyces sp. NPDC048252 TaxID=3154612 RepID=UPI003426FEA2